MGAVTPAEFNDTTKQPKIWMLALVPNIRLGRWLCAALLLTLLLGLYYLASLGNSYLPNSTDRYFSWPPALFFAVIVAYIVPVFHYITEQTQRTFDELAPYLTLSDDQILSARQKIAHKSVRWHLVTIGTCIMFWLIQSQLLTGSWERFLVILTNDFSSVSMLLGPLLVWLSVTIAVVSLVSNAQLFRQLTPHLNINLLDSRSVLPIGRMAVSSTLVVIGAQALFPIMWLSQGTSWWATVPGLTITTIALIYLLIAPLWPIHRRLSELKTEELASLQVEINQRAKLDKSWASKEALAPLLSYRNSIANISEWPFDMSALSRLLGYAVIVPLTWIGAALIEMVVDGFVG